MTDQEINIAIAESVGWQEKEIAKKCSCPDCQGYECCRWDFTEMPNYCADLNAMHDVEKSLNTREMAWKYLLHLERLMAVTYGLARTQSKYPLQGDSLHATARQRAEAYLRTISKWKEVA